MLTLCFRLVVATAHRSPGVTVDVFRGLMMPSPTAAIPPARGRSTRVAIENTRGRVPGPVGLPRAAGVSSGEATRRAQLIALRQVLSDSGPHIVYQPQLSLARLVVDGYEALARFPESPIRGTERWFARARELGLGAALEAAAVRRALHRGSQRPVGSSLAINLSPGVLSSPAVAAALPDNLTGIEIELTEHESAPGIGRLRRQLDHLRERGARVAIDDVGVAHSGLRRVMDLAPDRIKLDRHLVQGVAENTAKAALIRAVVDLAEHIGAAVCAEGVENVDDLEALAELDVGYAQGWLIGLPETDFQGCDPIAVAAGRDSLTRLLLGRPRRAGGDRITLDRITTLDRTSAEDPSSTESQSRTKDRTPRKNRTAGVDELLTQLTRVTNLDGLSDLVATCAGVLGGDTLQVSVLSQDGESIRPLGRGPTEATALADLPITRRCLETRAVIPIYLGTDGDPAQWQALTRAGFDAALLVPVCSRDSVIGLLECQREGSTPWSRRQIRYARTVAAMLGPVLDLLVRSSGTAPEQATPTTS